MAGRLVVLAIIASLFCWPLQAAQTSSPAATWVVGARPFALTSSRFQDTSGLADLATTVPALILEHLADAGVRILSPEELLQRQLRDLHRQRTGLAGSLSAAIKERDRQLFLSGDGRAVARNLREKEKEIVKVRGQLAELDQEIGRVRLLVKDGDYSGVGERRETVALWQDDPGSLFQPERVRDEGINGLLTGELAVSGNYLSARVELAVYPGRLHAVEVRAAASLADVSALSQEIAGQLKPVVQNRPTVLVDFEVTPGEAGRQARILVDGQVFQLRHFEGGELLLPAGSHAVVVESEGFRTKSFTGEFEGSGRFLVSVALSEAGSRPVEVVPKEFREGGVYINGFPVGGFNQEMELPTGLVFGTVLPTPLPKPGEPEASPDPADHAGPEGLEPAESPDSPGPEAAPEPAEVAVPPGARPDSVAGGPYYFVADIPPGAELLQLNVTLRRSTEEISSRIEKRRRVMYNSYSALLVSLVPSFVFYGLYNNMHNGWALGHEDEETVRMWKNISTGSIILSAGLGVNFAVQLGLFLGAADSVLPERARPR